MLSDGELRVVGKKDRLRRNRKSARSRRTDSERKSKIRLRRTEPKPRIIFRCRACPLTFSTAKEKNSHQLNEHGLLKYDLVHLSSRQPIPIPNPDQIILSTNSFILCMTRRWHPTPLSDMWENACRH
jgi:hypothetical protein